MLMLLGAPAHTTGRWLTTRVIDQPEELVWHPEQLTQTNQYQQTANGSGSSSRQLANWEERGTVVMVMCY